MYCLMTSLLVCLHIFLSKVATRTQSNSLSATFQYVHFCITTGHWHSIIFWHSFPSSSPPRACFARHIRTCATPASLTNLKASILCIPLMASAAMRRFLSNNAQQPVTSYRVHTHSLYSARPSAMQSCSNRGHLNEWAVVVAPLVGLLLAEAITMEITA